MMLAQGQMRMIERKGSFQSGQAELRHIPTNFTVSQKRQAQEEPEVASDMIYPVSSVLMA